MMLALQVVLALAALFLLTGTLLNFTKHPHWFIRIWDFPRAQITVVGLLAQAALWRWGSNSRGDRALAVALATANLYQIGKIRTKWNVMNPGYQSRIEELVPFVL